MKVRFVAVTEDSRCPRDVTCIWAGEVKVQLEIQESSKAASKVEILEGASTVAGAYRVTVVRVEPFTREYGADCSAGLSCDADDRQGGLSTALRRIQGNSGADQDFLLEAIHLPADRLSNQEVTSP